MQERTTVGSARHHAGRHRRAAHALLRSESRALARLRRCRPDLHDRHGVYQLTGWNHHPQTTRIDRRCTALERARQAAPAGPRVARPGRTHSYSIFINTVLMRGDYAEHIHK